VARWIFDLKMLRRMMLLAFVRGGPRLDRSTRDGGVYNTGIRHAHALCRGTGARNLAASGRLGYCEFPRDEFEGDE